MTDNLAAAIATRLRGIADWHQQWARFVPRGSWHDNVATDLAGAADACERLAQEIVRLQGAANADEERLRRAATDAGIPYFGCDTPEHLAQEIARLTAVLARKEKG